MNNLPVRSTRPLWGLIGVLFALNVGLVSWLCIAPSQAATTHHPTHHPAKGAAVLADSLHLSATQRMQYDVLRSRYYQQVKPLTQTCRQECQRYFLLLDSTDLSDEALATRSQAALASKVAVDVMTVRHLQQVAALCTPAQRQVLRQMVAPDCSAEGCRVGEGSPMTALPIVQCVPLP